MRPVCRVLVLFCAPGGEQGTKQSPCCEAYTPGARSSGRCCITVIPGNSVLGSLVPGGLYPRHCSRWSLRGLEVRGFLQVTKRVETCPHKVGRSQCCRLLAAAFFLLGLHARAQTGGRHGFPQTASTVLCAGTQPPRCDCDILLSTWQQGPDPQEHSP